MPDPVKQLTTAFQDDQEEKVYNLEDIYTDQEKNYREFLLRRLESAKNQRDQSHDELNGMSYPKYYEENLKAAISYIPPRESADEANIVTGTTREKKLAIMSAILNLNLEPNITAYNQDNLKDAEAGQTMTDFVKKSEDLENWSDELKLLAYDELTTQGNCFVEELWLVETKWDKKKVKLEGMTLETFKDFKPTKKLKEVFRGCKRNVIPGIFVYLGNIKEFDQQQQPYLYTREVVPYDIAKASYGTWPRWKYVGQTIQSFDGQVSDTSVYGMNFKLEESTPEGWVEIIKYQDRWNDEYQILLNGVMQLPAEFPMPWEHGLYSIEKGNLEPISSQFAYCMSVPTKTKTDQEVLDEMYRLIILKTQKSFLPPMANYSNQVLSKSAFLPGHVEEDIPKGAVEILGGDHSIYSVTQAELSVVELIKKFIDEKSVNPLLAGDSPQGNPTATEVMKTEQQAKVRLGLMIFGFMAFHQKLTYLRIYNILENWMKPIGQELDELKQTVVDKYRQITVDSETEDGQPADKVIEMTTQFQDPYALMDREEGITRDPQGNIIGRKKQTRPKRIMQVNPQALRALRYTWKAETLVSERETSLVNKVVFNESLQQAMVVFGPQAINMDYAKQKWAVNNNLQPTKFFSQGQSSMPPGQLQDQMSNNPGMPVSDQVQPKTPPTPGINQLTQG